MFDDELIYKWYDIEYVLKWDFFNMNWRNNYRIRKHDVRRDMSSMRFVFDITEAKSLIDILVN